MSETKVIAKKMRKTHWKLHSGEKSNKDDKEDGTFEIAQWTKVKQRFKEDDTFENSQWRKVN